MTLQGVMIADAWYICSS